MVNRILKVLIEFNSKECALESKRAIHDFALCEANFLVEDLDEYFKVEYVNDKFLRLTLYGDEVKVLFNVPYTYKSNSCPHTITLLYSDCELIDEMILPNYLLEINEHRTYEDSYSNNERENISYMEPITNNIFPLKIVDKNIYIKNIDIDNEKIDILCGENKDEGELKTVSQEIDVQFNKFDQGGNTEESFYRVTNVVKIRLIKL